MRRWCIVAFVLAAAISFAPSVARAAGWVNVCSFDHRLGDNPIEEPGDPGASELYDFFGNKSTDAFSTYRSLLHHNTSCDMNADKAAYWAPALKSGGHFRKPSSVKIYYRTNTTPVSDIEPYPRGLKIVAGNSDAKRPQLLRYVSWGCGDQEYDHPIDCGADNIVAHINFPTCWDGKRKDSGNHKRHMSYPHDGKCGKRHPVPVPRLIIRIEWPVHDGRHVRLSSGPYYTLHADFFNAWRQHRLSQLVHDCINADVNCGTPGS